MERLLKEIRILKLYSAALTLVCIVFIFLAFRGSSEPHFKEIDVERINIVEKDGTLKMVISNKERQHPGMVNHTMMKPREREAGMIFFNSKGDECGGLVYDGDEKGSGMAYSIDQRNTDQIMQLQYSETVGKEKRRIYGLKLWDRPDDFTLEKLIKVDDSLKKLNDPVLYKKAFAKLNEEGKLGSERFFAGKTADGDVGLFLRDNKGKVRLRIYVDKNDKTHLESLDENGNVVKNNL
ncbi:MULTISPECIES: hypothetical protein [Chryseobacterium]|uniref:Uncharacterized protein n=1 Tax=Chryseobacterium camelliae TaxID=1265445 RepID=A0ABU0TLD9_9FLAO|nr:MULTISPECIES: hypothetical protein [Chryseobacterium]MDT3408284.1 hypothetical protein [Pseudacidovorax intermedius]MDQ1097860.1 hypothetical protein [Chryseobacterium camelliae]MDQ1101795.1 hypothetical protein [Chryseobacterium sp. SORGH_AS_1048]MDR6085233.1 hypothetical protein [Chryseobacterium sp. SORGH_AS_0909]MDR6129591.1 hypothetical protein [Chryseobacterium sp. SORGH_AS_1175]